MSDCTLAHSDAAYVLGSLSPTDRLEFERHLPGCESCRRSVAELAGLPGLLGRVPVEQVEAPVPFEPLPATVLPALVAVVRREQRRKAVLVTLGAAAAIVVVALGVGALQAGRDDGRVPEATATTAAPSVAEFQAMTVVKDYGMTAEVSLTPGSDGTSVLVNCDYVESEEGEGHSYRYNLMVFPRSGEPYEAMHWRAGPGDHKKGIPGWAKTPLQDIQKIEVTGESGWTILRLDL
jgi:hypothetical protein